MRTTLTLDDSLARALKEMAHRSGRSFTEVVNEVLRAGLARRCGPSARPYKLRPASLGGVVPAVDLDNALQRADTLEDVEIARKLDLRK
jgi:plasmid stability protein